MAKYQPNLDCTSWGPEPNRKYVHVVTGPLKPLVKANQQEISRHIYIYIYKSDILHQTWQALLDTLCNNRPLPSICGSLKGIGRSVVQSRKQWPKSIVFFTTFLLHIYIYYINCFILCYTLYIIYYILYIMFYILYILYIIYYNLYIYILIYIYTF